MHRDREDTLESVSAPPSSAAPSSRACCDESIAGVSAALDEIRASLRRLEAAASEAKCSEAAPQPEDSPTRRGLSFAKDTARTIVAELLPWMQGELDRVVSRAAESAAERTAVRTAEWVTKLLGKLRRVSSAADRGPMDKEDHLQESEGSLRSDDPAAAKIGELFRCLDRDGDGQVTRQEAMAFFKCPFGRLSTEAMFNEVDIDCSAHVTLAEFISFWNNVKRAGYSSDDIASEISKLLQGQAWVDWLDGRQVESRAGSGHIAISVEASEIEEDDWEGEGGGSAKGALAERDSEVVPMKSAGQSSSGSQLRKGSLSNFRSQSVLAALHDPTSRNFLGTEEERTNKALVVNFRRLIKMREFFGIMHEIIKSTTIAFLTLVAVRNAHWLAMDLLALTACVSLYALHANKFDTLEVADYNNLVELLGDDGESAMEGAPIPLENPNRWLQAVTYSKTMFHVLMPTFLVSIFVVLDIISWGVVVASWCEAPVVEEVFGAYSQETLEHPVTLLLVGTLMLFCHLCFEIIFWRETQYCLPLKNDRPWRIHEDGMPRDMHLCSLFGPPCIWFSTPQAYDDLRIWVTLASGEHAHGKKGRSQKILPKVFFEELALYAIQEETSATRLRRSLLQAKLFDKKTDCFLRRGPHASASQQHQQQQRDDHKVPHVEMRGVTPHYSGNGKVGFYKVDIKAGQRPEELGLDLLFYDNRSGVYWAPDSHDIEVFRDKVVSHQLRKCNSLSVSHSTISSKSASSFHPL